MAMAEVGRETAEELPKEQTLYRLDTTDPARINRALVFFQEEGMHGPQAAQRVLSLFKAFPQDTKDPSGLLNPDKEHPETLWDQVGWAYSHPNALLSAQKETLIPLLYFGLDALAHPSQSSEISGSERRALERTKGRAEKVLAEYDTYVANVFDPDLPEWKIPVGKITTRTAMGLATAAFLLSACGPVTTPTTVETLIPATETPFIVPTILLPTETASVLLPYPSEVKNIDLGTDTLITDQVELLNTYGDYPGQILGHMLAELNHEGKIQDNPDTAVLYKELFQKYNVHLYQNTTYDTWVLVLQDKATGKFLIPRMTTGTETGQLRRDLMLPQEYVSQKIGTRFFEFATVDAYDIGSDTGSHWTVLFTENSSGKPVSWFNADKEITVSMSPEATATPSATATETAIPVPEYYKGLAGTLDEFTLIQKDDLKTVEQDILDHPTLAEPQALPYDAIIPFNDGTFTGVLVQCVMGQNCAVRASVRVADPANGPDRWYVIWEVRNAGDDHSHVIITYIGKNVDESTLERQTQETILRDLQRAAQEGATDTLSITTKRIGQFHYSNPVLLEMIDNATPDQRAALDELQKTCQIPDSLSNIPVSLSYVTRTN